VGVCGLCWVVLDGVGWVGGWGWWGDKGRSFGMHAHTWGRGITVVDPLVNV
jgi:hypothetical protein